MSDFKIYESKIATSGDYPFLLDVQSELLSVLDTRLVIPLVTSSEVGKNVIKNLNPEVKIKENLFVAMTQQMAAIPKSMLGNNIENVEFSRSEILSSIDFLVTGI